MRLALFVIVIAAACVCRAQQPTPSPSPTPAREEQEPIKVFTQEVRVPVAAFDQFENFDPTLEARDLLVLEDDVPQQVRSITRAPANVLVVFDLGGKASTATRNDSTARDATIHLIASLRRGDHVALVQNSRRAEVFQDWTDDLGYATHALQTKFFTAERSRLSECLALAAAKLREQPVGNTHVVIFTDGLELQSKEEISAGTIRGDAMQSLVATQASVHVFSFASLVNDFVRMRNHPVTVGTGAGGNSVKVVIDTDAAMRRWFRAYARATLEREEQLTALAEEAGTRLLQPRTPDEIIKLTERVGRDISAQYIITYKPQRPFTSDSQGERRHVTVRPRRAGLDLEVLRTVVTVTTP
ncbi:MAG: VWA domain-containing protein [Pyrinomonadaceae bacterium]